MNQEKFVSKCRRCGTCCEKGGPAFHIEDRQLIEKGIIPTKFVYTIRQGELAYDNIRRALLPVTTDVLKMKSRGETLCCIFYNEQEMACRIYENRPVECRALKCWDTRELEDIFEKNRLTRKDLLAEVEGLWDLIDEHDRRCSYEKLGQLVARLKQEKSNAIAGQIVEIVEYDNQLRKLVIERGQLDPQILDFLFGRPLEETFHMFGLKIERKEGKNARILIRAFDFSTETPESAE